MSEKQDIRSFWNPNPRLGEAAQKEHLTGTLYGPTERKDLIRSMRVGSIVEVVELYLLAGANLKAGARKKDLIAVIAEIQDKPKFGIILEASTGRRSDNPKEWREMLAQAFEQIARSGKVRKSALNGALSQGAPKWTPTKEQDAVIDKEWFRRTNTTDNERMAAIQEKLGKLAPSRTTIRKYYGSPYAVRKPGK